MAEHWIAGDLLDRTVLDRQGDRVGRVERVYVDAVSGAPSFIAINTGLLSRSPSVVPLVGATAHDDALVLPLEREQIKIAPTVEPEGQGGGLTPAQERTLLRYYRLTPETQAPREADTPRDAGGPPPDAAAASAGTAAAASAGSAAPAADDDAMTRSEEQLRVHTEERPVARARLKKHLVTEDVQITVPVTREEFHVEWETVQPGAEPEPEPDSTAATDDDGLVLHEERVVVRTETVATERVRLAKDRVTDEETITDQVRREKITLENPDD